MTIKSDQADGGDGRKNNSLATQTALQEAGRRLFGEQGYGATSVTALCTAAGVTAGALYHHYGDKKGLFAAVAEDLDKTLVSIAAHATMVSLTGGASTKESFLVTIDALLEAACDPVVRMIGLVDAPAVLGTQGWYQIRERQGLGAMIQAVERLQGEGDFVAGDPKRMAQMILGLLYSAIHTLPTNLESDRAAFTQTKDLLHGMLRGLFNESVTKSGKRVSLT